MIESLWNGYDILHKSPEVPVKRSPKVVIIIIGFNNLFLLRVLEHIYKIFQLTMHEIAYFELICR